MTYASRLPAPPHPKPPHHQLMPHWLTHLGALGLFSVAVLDSSVIPLPLPGSTDLLLLWLVAHGGDPRGLALCAISGSLLGGYTTWHVGKKGGQAALRRYLPARFLDRIVGWVERHPALAVFLPSLLPPPFPLSPFVLATGALGVPVKRFLAVFGAARAIRYSLVAWLAVAYGRHVVRLWSGTLQKWSAPILWTFAAIAVCGLCAGIWKLRQARRDEAAETSALQSSSSRTY